MLKNSILVSALAGLVLPVNVAAAADSPQFRGPGRDGVFADTALLASWPDGGPEKLWSRSGLGTGYASLTVVAGRIYTTGERQRVGYVTALDLEGKKIWQTPYGEVHNGSGYPGTRATPTFHDGRLYFVTSAGKVFALDADSGKVVWQKDLLTAYGAGNIQWGLTEAPLIVDGKVIVTPGGRGGTVVALDPKTGEGIWASPDMGDTAAYCSARLLVSGEHRQIVTLTQKHVIGVDLRDGALLWQHKYVNQYDIHAVSPLFVGDSIYVTEGYTEGTQVLALAEDGKSVSVRWQEKRLNVLHGGLVVKGGLLYGAAARGTWYALDAASGEIRGEIPRAGKGVVVYADDRLYGYNEKGEVLLVDPDPASFEVVSRFQIQEGEGQHWAHPVIAGGVLYVRHGDVVMAFDVAESP